MAERVSLEPAPGLRVSWELAADEGTVAPVPPWSLEGSLAPGHSALRVVTGTTGAATLLLAAARPAGAEHHDEELVAAVVVTSEGDHRDIDESLLSTQYAGDGSVRRVTIELELAEEDYPLRGAADATANMSGERDGMRVETAELDFRFDGEAGHGSYSILHA